MANRILEWVGGLGGWLLCLAVFALAFGESAALVDLAVPGEVGMVIAGAAAAQGNAPLWGLIVAATVGAVVGDQLSYQLGRHYGASLADRWQWTRRHVRPRIDRAREHFERRGGAAVFLGRWVGALRAVVPFVAGTSGMPPGRFLGWNVLGAATWAPAVIIVGYLFGRPIAHLVDRFSLWLSLVAIVGVAGWLAYKWMRRRSPQHAEAAQR